jgi:hypothetical protein
MSALMHTLAARIRAVPLLHLPKTPDGGSHHRDTCRVTSASPAAKSRKWVIAGLR